MWKIEEKVKTYSDGKIWKSYYIYRKIGFFSREYQLSFGLKKDYITLNNVLEQVEKLNKEPYLLKEEIRTL